MKEYLLSTNDFLNPAVSTGSDAYGILITRLLLLEPGTNPLFPEMGVGIGPKYRFISEDEMGELERRVQEQMNTYLPSEINQGSVVKLELKGDSKYLLISILTHDTKYIYDTEVSNTPIELSDLV